MGVIGYQIDNFCGRRRVPLLVPGPRDKRPAPLPPV